MAQRDRRVTQDKRVKVVPADNRRAGERHPDGNNPSLQDLFSVQNDMSDFAPTFKAGINLSPLGKTIFKKDDGGYTYSLVTDGAGTMTLEVAADSPGTRFNSIAMSAAGGTTNWTINSGTFQLTNQLGSIVLNASSSGASSSLQADGLCALTSTGAVGGMSLTSQHGDHNYTSALAGNINIKTNISSSAGTGDINLIAGAGGNSASSGAINLTTNGNGSGSADISLKTNAASANIFLQSGSSGNILLTGGFVTISGGTSQTVHIIGTNNSVGGNAIQLTANAATNGEILIENTSTAGGITLKTVEGTILIENTNALGGITITPGASAHITLDGHLFTPTGWANGNGLGFNGTGALVPITGIAPNGSAGGDLTGSYPNPTIANSAVTLGKMANLVADSIIGNNTGSPAAPLALTAAQVMALLSGSSGADFSLNSHKLTNVTDPASAQDAATKNYVDTRPAVDEIKYVEFTSDVNVTTAVQASAVTVVDAGSISFDGSTRVCIEFFSGSVVSQPGTETVFDLWDSTTDIGIFGTSGVLGGANGMEQGVLFKRYLTPSNASHDYKVKAWNTSGTTNIVRARLAGYIRITKA